MWPSCFSSSIVFPLGLSSYPDRLNPMLPIVWSSPWNKKLFFPSLCIFYSFVLSICLLCFFPGPCLPQRWYGLRFWRCIGKMVRMVILVPIFEASYCAKPSALSVLEHDYSFSLFVVTLLQLGLRFLSFCYYNVFGCFFFTMYFAGSFSSVSFCLLKMNKQL
jgi:hypothetical protein